VSYRVILKPSAEKELNRLPKPIKSRVINKLTELETSARPIGSIKLAGAGATYRVRAGDYRIVYEVDDVRRIVFVTIIAHRRDVYRGL
jgi:mRNA interferase RelE/StbE